MAHTEEMLINGVMTPVVKFDHSAQEIDDTVDKMPPNGAAPAGYGSGEEGRLVTNPLTIDAGGFYSLSGDSAVNYPVGIPNSLYGVIYAIRRGVKVYLTFEYAGYIAYADFTIGDTAIVWNYLNPPMQLGVEYRTAERYMGKPVYVKLFNAGNIAAGATITVYFENENKTSDAIVEVDGFTYGNNQSFGSEYVSVINARGKGISLVNLKNNNTSYGMDTNYVCVKYTKTTD